MSIEGTDMKKEREISTPLLAFTFFYASAIYLLLLGFHFWYWRKNEAEQEQ